MTKEELQALIDAKIAGQGNQIDSGGALAQILTQLAGAAIPVEVSDITALTDEQLDSLEVGDKVAKKTGTAKHLYVVSYKDAENGGICLTYTDASTVETVSYDHGESGWSYNSTDKTNIGG
jgi:hypothetical protein